MAASKRTYEQAVQELAALRSSVAYANATRPGAPNHPEYPLIRRRAADLGAIVHERRPEAT